MAHPGRDRGGGQQALDRIGRAVNKARRWVWDLIAERHGGLPGIRVANRQITGQVGIRLYASLVDVHSDKELASPTWKKGFGFHPLLGYCDDTGESLAGMLRTGRAGSNTAADHVDIVDRCRGHYRARPIPAQVAGQL